MEHILDRQLQLPFEALAQRLPLDVGHDVVQQVASLARVVQRHDVRVLQLRRDLDFPEKPLRSQVHGEVRMQDFDRDRAIETRVASAVDLTHPPGSELPL